MTREYAETFLKKVFAPSKNFIKQIKRSRCNYAIAPLVFLDHLIISIPSCRVDALMAPLAYAMR